MVRSDPCSNQQQRLQQRLQQLHAAEAAAAASQVVGPVAGFGPYTSSEKGGRTMGVIGAGAGVRVGGTVVVHSNMLQRSP